MSYAGWSALVGITVILLGCGQKGPLILPDAPASHRKTTIPTIPARRPPPATASPVPAAPAGPTAPPSGPVPNDSTQQNDIPPAGASPSVPQR